MTTYHTFNSPPVPSDVELEMLDRVKATRTALLTLNEFIRYAVVRGVGIDCQRPDFHAFIMGDGGWMDRTPQQWWTAWHCFCETQDVIDERQTQLDARYQGAL